MTVQHAVFELIPSTTYSVTGVGSVIANTQGTLEFTGATEPVTIGNPVSPPITPPTPPPTGRTSMASGFTSTVARSTAIAGLNFKESTKLTGGSAQGREESVPVALSGALTTRTDNTTGTLTIPNNTIFTGARIDLYWVGGSRRGVIVGTVAGNSVPISLGAGDNLPIANTVVQAAIAQSYPVLFSGDASQLLALQSDNNVSGAVSTIVVADGSGELWYEKLKGTGVKFWTINDPETNPLAGTNPTHVYFSHNDTAAVHNMRIGALIS